MISHYLSSKLSIIPYCLQFPHSPLSIIPHCLSFHNVCHSWLSIIIHCLSFSIFCHSLSFTIVSYSMSSSIIYQSPLAIISNWLLSPIFVMPHYLSLSKSVIPHVLCFPNCLWFSIVFDSTLSSFIIWYSHCQSIPHCLSFTTICHPPSKSHFHYMYSSIIIKLYLSKWLLWYLILKMPLKYHIIFFLCRGADLDHVMYRMGVLAVLRSKAKKGNHNARHYFINWHPPLLDLFLITAKMHIYYCKFKGIIPNLDGFIRRVNNIKYIEKYIAVKNNKT